MITIEQVPVAEVVASQALIAEYAAECSIPAIGEINPQGEVYDAIEKAGVLRAFMVFEDVFDRIGFAIVLTPILPHYGARVATLESLFVARDKRKGGAGRKLMEAVERYAKDAACVGILYSSPAGSQLEKLLAASKEYQRTNAVFFRRLA